MACATQTNAPPPLPAPDLLPASQPPTLAVATVASLAALEFTQLESWLASRDALQLPLHQIESEQQTKGREVQRLLLQAHLLPRGNGDVGPALLVQREDGQVRYSHRRPGTRSLTTIFGAVQLTRLGYSGPGSPTLYPLDQVLALTS